MKYLLHPPPPGPGPGPGPRPGLTAGGLVSVLLDSDLEADRRHRVCVSGLSVLFLLGDRRLVASVLHLLNTDESETSQKL